MYLPMPLWLFLFQLFLQQSWRMQLWKRSVRFRLGDWQHHCSWFRPRYTQQSLDANCSYSNNSFLVEHFEIVVCHLAPQTISCHDGFSLAITNATYGRVDNTECRDGRYGINSSQMNPATPCQESALDYLSNEWEKLNKLLTYYAVVVAIFFLFRND